MINTYTTIDQIYTTPLTEESVINIRYSGPSDGVREHVSQLRDAIDVIVDRERHNLCVAHIRPLNLSRDKAEALRSAIKSDSQWQDYLCEMIHSLVPDTQLSKEDMVNSINRPWWNGSVLSKNSDKYDAKTGILDIDASMTHTYLTQMSNSLKLQRSASRSLSISGIVQTADGIIPLGLRGGQSFYDTIMTTPAGSIEYHSGKNPLFETMYAETLEELGLEKSQLNQVRLIGSMHENALSNYAWYVFEAKTPLTFSELLNNWAAAIDNREHKYLLPVLDHADHAMTMMQTNLFNADAVDKNNVAITTLRNVNTVLPQASASLLVHYGQREGQLWCRKACELLGETCSFAGDDYVR